MRLSFSLFRPTRLNALCAGFFALCASLGAAPKPNVLFICVDDLVPALGAYGDSIAKTPQIDSLGAQGMVFRNHHCTWPVCGPSRSALTTSLMPEETNVLGFKKIRDKNYLPNVTTLPQHFRNNGYETAATGKFHDPRTVGTPTAISGTYPDGVLDDGNAVDDPASWSVPYVQAGAGFSTPTHTAVDMTDQPDSLYSDHLILTAGLALIDDLVLPGGSAPGNKPFFLAVGFKKPHLPFVAPKAYWDLHDRNAMPLAQFTSLPVGATTYNNNALLNNGELLGGTGDPEDGYLPYSSTQVLPTTAQQRELIHGYYACVSFVDNLVGQLRTKLAATDDPRQPGKKLSETTIVVLWGDHGFHLGDHGRWAKHTIMEKATSCPLIIHDPRIVAAAHSTTQPASTLDIYPTLCELAALPIPQQPLTTAGTTGRPLRGRSLVPLLTDPTARVHHGVVSHFSINGQYGYAYRTERFRYIEWISSTGNMNDGNARRDLYDYVNDPNETRNLADDPAYAGLVYQLSRSLRAETTIRGTGRLNSAAAIATGGNALLPAMLTAAPGNNAQLAWWSAGGVSYNVAATASLAPAAWVNDFTNIAGPGVIFPVAGASRFFRVGFGTNTPPRWNSDPLTKPWAVAGSGYSASLAADATDPGDTLTFSKVNGPAWLSVAANGAISGTPSASGADVADYFTVQVADSWNNVATACLQIPVGDPAVNHAPVFTSDPIVKTDATSGTAYTGSLAGNATDADPGHTLTFSRVGGPSWLSVASDGTLGGTPSVAHVGLNIFTVRVTDPLGASDDAQLQLNVVDGALNIVVATQTDVSGGATNYGTVFFRAVTVQTGDVVVVAHAVNKNTATNTITMSGLTGNTVASLNSGSTGTTSSAWILYSTITAAGTFDITLDTSNTGKTCSQATSLFVLRPVGGTLQIAATDTSLAPSSATVTTLSLDFAMSPAVTGAYGITACAMNTSTLSAAPAGWTEEAASVSKRITYSRSGIGGSVLSVPFASPAATDMALAGIIVKIVP